MINPLLRMTGLPSSGSSGASQRIKNIKIIAAITFIAISLLFTPIPYIGCLWGLYIVLKIVLNFIANIVLFLLALYAVKRASSSKQAVPPVPPSIEIISQKNSQLNGQLHLNSIEAIFDSESREYAELNLNSLDKDFYNKFKECQIKKNNCFANPSSTDEERVNLMRELMKLRKELWLPGVSENPKVKKWIGKEIERMIDALSRPASR